MSPSEVGEDVAVAIVTHGGATDLPACLAALARQTVPVAEVVVADNASPDDCAAVARRLGGELGLPLAVLELGGNRGFSVGMNAALAASRAPWVLSLNADATLAPDFLERLLARRVAHPALRIGALTGRLLRLAAAGAPDRLDACGMRLTRSWRHLDRGSGEVDRGQYARAARVFGGTGAATLYRRAALADVAIDGAAFDEAFFAFREDAELAFRLRERGWEVVYEPAAQARHRRSNLPARRRAMAAVVNYHGVKNRYLLRLYHQRGVRNLIATLLPTLGRDLLALVYVLCVERSSLAAYRYLWRERGQLLARRRLLAARQTVPAAAIDRWFTCDELPLPAEGG